MAISQDTPIFENSNTKDRLAYQSIYNKAYREANKERLKEYNKTYRESHKEKIKAYLEANKDKIKDRCKAYQEANKESLKEYRKEYQEANKEKRKEYNKTYNKTYREANKDKKNIHHRNRRARKRNAEGSHTAADIQQLLTLQRKKCAVCHTSITKGYHVDHVIPLAMNGSNDKYNLQLLCAPCNISKKAKHPVNFMQERGFLL